VGNCGQAGDKDGETVVDAGLLRGIKLIHGAEKLAGANALKNARELAFHMH
jgi:hypothetical protein